MGRSECVAYWSGPIDQGGVVDALVHPRHSATPAHYAPDQHWLHEFFIDLVRTGRTVRAQVRVIVLSLLRRRPSTGGWSSLAC